MVLNINYSEIQDIIKQKVNKDIKLSPVDSQTICVSIDISLPLIGKKEVRVQLKLEVINNQYALLSYSNGLGVDLVITAILKYLEMQSNVSYVQGLPDNRIKIQLNQIPQAQSALKAIELQALVFTNSCAEIEFALK